MTSFSMQAFDSGLYSAMTASTALMAAVGSASGFPKVYRLQAPQGVFPPFVIYWHQHGGELNATPRDEQDFTIGVKCIASDTRTAWNVDSIMRDILHGGSISVTGWDVFRVNRTNLFEYQEPLGGSPVFHAGSFYRVRMSADSA